MNDNQGRLTSILQQEATTLEGLYELLMKELVALKERNSDSISELSEEKNSLIDTLEVLDKERQQLFNSDSNHTNEINVLSNEIELCLGKCKKQNSINGGIIEMSQLFNEKMLDIICGNSEKETTYSATGKNNTKSSQHSLGRV
jgi:flagellar biosynthesis protein FlgN